MAQTTVLKLHRFCVFHGERMFVYVSASRTATHTFTPTHTDADKHKHTQREREKECYLIRSLIRSLVCSVCSHARINIHKTHTHKHNIHTVIHPLRAIRSRIQIENIPPSNHTRYTTSMLVLRCCCLNSIWKISTTTITAAKKTTTRTVQTER